MSLIPYLSISPISVRQVVKVSCCSSVRSSKYCPTDSPDGSGPTNTWALTAAAWDWPISRPESEKR